MLVFYVWVRESTSDVDIVMISPLQAQRKVVNMKDCIKVVVSVRKRQEEHYLKRGDRNDTNDLSRKTASFRNLA